MSTEAPSTPIRLTIVATHPVQYYAPWFRWIHTNCPDLDLRVIYAAAPTPRQQGTGFDCEFTWDVPLTDGYDCTVVRAAHPADRFDSEHFWGLNVPAIADAIADRRPDVVVVFGWYSVTLVRAIRAARRLRIPVLYYGDTNLQSAPAGWRRALWVAKTRRLLSCFSGYLSVGTRSAVFLRFFGVPDSLIFATPHAVDNDRFAEARSLRACASRRAEIRRALGLPDDRFVVLFAGKLEPVKRPLDLVEALGRMHPRPHLAIAGAGVLEASVGAAAGRLGVDCSMLGFVNQSEMLRVYAAADCLALPSESETWGLVVNEALAAGLPCVLADTVGCVPDLGGPETGGVYPTADPTELINGFAATLSGVRDRLEAGHDFTAACQARASLHSFAQATAGLVRGCRTVTHIETAQAGTPAGEGAGLRVVACCGGMVLVSGLERMTFEVLRVAREHGGAVHCIVNSWENHRIVPLADGIGASWSIGSYTSAFSRHTLNPVRQAQSFWDILRTSAGLLRDASRFRATHVLVPEHSTVLRNAPALALLRLAGVHVVFRVAVAPERGRFYRGFWRHLVAPLVTRFVANSQFSKTRLLEVSIPARKITLIQNTVSRRSEASTADNDIVTLARSRRTLLAVGQIAPFKGTHLVVEAAVRLMEKDDDLQLLIVGEVPTWPADLVAYARGLEDRVTAAGLSGRIRFVGARHNVLDIMRASYLFVAPILQEETFGNVVLEAKTVGLPSVVFPKGGLVELVKHQETGFVCRDDSLEALLEGLTFYLSSPEARARASRRSIESSADPHDEYGFARFARRWLVVFGLNLPPDGAASDVTAV